MRIKRLLRPAPHLERHAAQHALLVAVGGALALGALVGIAWAAGFGRVADQLQQDPPGKHPFGAVCDEEITARLEARRGERGDQHIARGARGDGRAPPVAGAATA